MINNNPCFFQNFALELTLENKAEFDEDAFKSELGKIGGANYGTGVRAWLEWSIFVAFYDHDYIKLIGEHEKIKFVAS